MKSFEQIAAAMYHAYCKQARELDEEGLAGHAAKWQELDAGTRECWVAAAKQAVAEVAALH